MRLLPVMSGVVWTCTVMLSNTASGQTTGAGRPADAAGAKSSEADAAFVAVRDAYLAKYQPLWCESETAWWDANISGADAAFARKKELDKQMVELHSDRAIFAKLKAWHDGGQIADPTHQRELDIMYRSFLPGQADPALQKQIVDLENDVEQIFNTHRSHVAGKTLTENDVRTVLSDSTSSADVEAAWKGYMAVGEKAAPKLRELVKLRNELAGQLGFKNFYLLRLALQELDQPEFFQLMQQVDDLTREPFAKLKHEIDAARAARFHIQEGDLRPWHFGDLFFQEAPLGQEVNLDTVYKDADLIALAKKYYDSIGLPVEDIIARSDLYEKPGKCPHAFCTNLDRVQNIRVLANIKPNLYSADTLLHELGHGVYDQAIRPELPFLLREASHGLTTEGIANMFGSMAKNEDFLVKVRGLAPAEAAKYGEAARSTLRTEKLVFSRWTLVMVHFEHGMYCQPDQDLGKLWWDLKKRYQLLNPPESVERPDYAAKVHILTEPVYYHNYLMGELFASQVRHQIASKVLGASDPSKTCFYGQPKVGQYLREQVFGPGSLYSWNELTRRATGEPLKADYFADEFVR